MRFTAKAQRRRESAKKNILCVPWRPRASAVKNSELVDLFLKRVLVGLRFSKRVCFLEIQF